VTSVNFTAADMDYQRAGALHYDPGHDERSAAWFQTASREQSYRFFELATLFRNAKAAGARFEGSCVRGVDFSGSDLTPAVDDDGVDQNFNDAGISLANFSGITGLSEKAAFLGACATQAPLNLPVKQDLTCPSAVGGMTSVPADALSEAEHDRCNRDVFTELAPAANSPIEEDVWPAK
jgi:uncharacterized protein YjbI with pentapeptide repeats